MKTLNLVILSFLFLVSACSKEANLNSSCKERIFEKLNLIEYDGQDLGCDFFVELYRYKSEFYFLSGNHCIDMISYPLDCDGNKLCDSAEDKVCKKFFRNAKRIEIIGVQE